MNAKSRQGQDTLEYLTLLHSHITAHKKLILNTKNVQVDLQCNVKKAVIDLF